MKRSGRRSRLAATLSVVALVVGASAGAAESGREETIPIRSIDPADADFGDLRPLKERIAAARVVVLGEATHSEGSTSAAKARMVRFLHAEMGFDVLAWETGLIQAWAMNAALRDPERPTDVVAAFLMPGGWATEKPVLTLLEYARSTWRTRHPLEMAGFDSDRPFVGSKAFLAVLRDLSSRSPSLQLDDAEWARVEHFGDRVFGFLGAEKPREEERARQRATVEFLLTRLRERRPALRVGASERELDRVERFLVHALQDDELAAAGEAWARARDERMADNLLWVLETVHPGRKVIVWAATAHFIRNSDAIRNDEHPDWYVEAWEAGNRIHRRLGDDLYTIAFTSYAGEIGDRFPPGGRLETATEALEPAPAGSFEARAHAAGPRMAFYDLRSAPEGHWLRGEFVSLALGRQVNRAVWSQVVDAFFFIDQATPCLHLARR